MSAVTSSQSRHSRDIQQATDMHRLSVKTGRCARRYRMRLCPRPLAATETTSAYPKASEAICRSQERRTIETHERQNEHKTTRRGDTGRQDWVRGRPRARTHLRKNEAHVAAAVIAIQSQGGAATAARGLSL